MGLTITFKSFGICTNQGEIVQIQKDHNGNNRYACGEYRYTLCTGTDNPKFQLPTFEEIASAYLVDQQWYNSSEDRPSHGHVDLSTTHIVEITEVTTIWEVTKPLPIVVTEFLLRTVVYKLKTALILDPKAQLKEGDLIIAGYLGLQKVKTIIPLPEEIRHRYLEENDAKDYNLILLDAEYIGDS